MDQRDGLNLAEMGVAGVLAGMGAVGQQVPVRQVAPGFQQVGVDGGVFPAGGYQGQQGVGAVGGEAYAPPPVNMAGPGVDLNTLLQLFQHMNVAARPAAEQRFKLPEYSGDSDVEMFISTFVGIMEVSQWTPQVALLHLRSCLRGPALDSARGDNVVQALDALRRRFGMTEAQARERLATVRHDGKESLHVLGSEVEKLVTVAYPMVNEVGRCQLAMEAFKRALQNCGLQQHLLAVPARSVDELVVAAEAYMQVGGAASSRQWYRPQVAALGDFQQPPAVGAVTDMSALMLQVTKALENSSRAIERLAAASSQTQAQPAASSVQNVSKSGGMVTGKPMSGACFNCGGPHIKRNCPNKASGNADRPLQ
jgi:hypothetical protein